MLTDKQSLLLCGLMVGGILVAGILDVLKNFIVLTILTIIFLVIVINLFYSKLNPNEEPENQNKKEAV
ncbi:hypothetical protein Q4Q34_13455 [Flavivirga abyssicola]|uniref:hypothetical protein n=1 Tax=Flavivirga abyssicola TaxID=3063533 RepID=UPI0026DFB4FA|nr:hypothetical protein [Flavivirga sp. MEBiC07777]WVK12227.1 hypothetical protein Q4Q34_13455 [Flavivirga sp. MEBiC07777]